ncbi:MAG: GABA permease, partial [Corynebacterium variabile]
PVVAVVLSTIGGVVGCLVNFLFPDAGLFDFIMSSTGLVALFVYAFIALSNWNMRRKMTPEETAAVATKLRVPLFPLSNIIVLVGVAAVVVVMLIDGSTAEVWSSVVATAFIGVLWPVVKRRKRAAEKEAAA